MSALEEALSSADRSLGRYRLLVIIATALIAVILGIGLTIVYQDAETLQQQINNDFNQQQLMLATQAADQIAASLREVRAELERFSRYQPRLLTRADTLDAVKVLIEYARDEGVREVGVFSTDGTVTPYYSLGRGDTPSAEQIRRIVEELHGRPMMVSEPPRISGGLISRTVTGLLCVPDRVHGSGDRVLYARLDLTQLVGHVAADVRSGRTGYAWVIDSHGTFLYHPRQEYVARDAFTVRREYDRSGHFTTVNNLMRSRMIAGKQGTGSYNAGSGQSSEGSVTKLVAYTPVPSDLLPAGEAWSVAVAAPEHEVAEAVRAATKRHILAEGAMIASMFLLGILALFYERRISRSLSRRVAEQEEYLSNILQNTVDGIILIDTDNRVLVWNRGAELIFGYTEAEMLGQTFHHIIPPDLDADDELRRIADVVKRDGFIRNFRAYRVTKDGRRITVDISRTLTRAADGEPIGSVAVIKDVTEEVAMEQRLYNTEKLASIGTLAAGVAHEINNPLAVILGFTDLLKEKFPADSPETEDLIIIEQNAEAAKKTVDNLLGFSRVQEGQWSTMEIGQSLRTVLTIVTSTLLPEHIELRTEIADNLPPIRGDAREFQQVIFNLVNNAVAAMKDQDCGTLTISAWLESGRVCVRVTDTGPGIPDRIKARIFDPFFTTKGVGEGTGLGLSLCYGIIKKFGGSIDFFSHAAEDSPGEATGTSFTVAIPRETSADADEENEA